jgi:ribonuclease P protein component
VTAERGGERDEALPRARRITRSSEIRALFRRGKRSRTAHLDVFDSPSPAAHSRVALVVPRHKRTVVDRNLLKRRLREVLRRDVLPALRNRGVAVDVLVRARREAYETGHAELRGELITWVERRWSHASS